MNPKANTKFEKTTESRD